MTLNEQLISNPISDLIIEHINNTEKKLNIAVPFISSFARKIISQDYVNDIKDKRLITKFDETNINTFDIPTLKYLMACGFKIRFNNKIHLKLYITDSDAFVTSSNLTNGGFENNIELTVRIDSYNINTSSKIFNELWDQSKLNLITEKLLDENYGKYKVLRKKQKFEKKEKIEVETIVLNGPFDIQQIVDVIFNANEDYSERIQLSYEANKKRNKFKRVLVSRKFDNTLFYSSENHPQRRENLFYDFAYGTEHRLADTGLREGQFKDAFEHPDFQDVIEYIFPALLELPSWNLEDEKSRLIFCDGLFDFNIPQYSEALPIRLASYFYPDKFLPIFKLDHLQKVCNALGIDTSAKSKGERLFAYNSFLLNVMKDIPYNNYIKSDVAYQVLYTIELYKRLKNGEDFSDIKNSYQKLWVKNFIEKGKKTLKKINAIQYLK